MMADEWSLTAGVAVGDRVETKELGLSVASLCQCSGIDEVDGDSRCPVLGVAWLGGIRAAGLKQVAFLAEGG